MVQSKQKGGNFERLMCKKLSLWITNNKRSDVLWRSASSGAVYTISQKSGQSLYQSQSGDIAAIDPLGRKLTNLFTVELKCYKSLQLDNMIQGRTSVLEEFWLTHTNLAKEVKKLPMLIGKQNRGEHLLCLPGWFDKQLINIDSVVVKRLNLTIFLLDEVIDKMGFEHFRSLVGSINK